MPKPGDAYLEALAKLGGHIQPLDDDEKPWWEVEKKKPKPLPIKKPKPTKKPKLEVDRVWVERIREKPRVVKPVLDPHIGQHIGHHRIDGGQLKNVTGFYSFELVRYREPVGSNFLARMTPTPIANRSNNRQIGYDYLGEWESE